ncbi:MAG: GNAT family N-acetyltransferase [Candidatus Limnocylindria bacterium]
MPCQQFCGVALRVRWVRLPAVSPLPLETERLSIRAFTPDDVQAHHARIAGDADVMRVSPRGASSDIERTREAVERYIAHQRDHGFSLWAVDERGTGEYVGCCGLSLVEGRGPDVEVAYRFARDRWGRGYATEATRACLAYGLGELGLERIVAMTTPDHAASRRVMEKNGMRFVGPARFYQLDLVLYEAAR